MKAKLGMKLTNKEFILSAKFEVKEQFNKSGLENLKTRELLIHYKKSGEID